MTPSPLGGAVRRVGSRQTVAKVVQRLLHDHDVVLELTESAVATIAQQPPDCVCGMAVVYGEAPWRRWWSAAYCARALLVSQHLVEVFCRQPVAPDMGIETRPVPPFLMDDLSAWDAVGVVGV